MNNPHNPCVCGLHLPEVGKKLKEMRQEIMKIVEEAQPSRRRYILHVVTKEIKEEIVQNRLQHGRCFSMHCFNEIPAMSRHFVCPADYHIRPIFKI